MIRLQTKKRSPLFFSAAVGVITLITFVRVLSADFVMWDDDWVICNNPNLTGLSLASLRSIFTEADSLEDLKVMAQDAVRCYFNEAEKPPIIRKSFPDVLILRRVSFGRV